MKQLMQKAGRAAMILLWIPVILMALLTFFMLAGFILDTVLSYLFSAPEIEYQNYHRWTARESDLFFDCSSEYYQYENGCCNMIGRLRTEEGEIELCVLLPGSSWGNILEFHRVSLDEAASGGVYTEDYFRYDAYSGNQDRFSSSLLYNTMGVSLPKRITFTCEEIAPEELYRPAWLGEKEEEPDG